jgi:hypothetical protein
VVALAPVLCDARPDLGQGPEEVVKVDPLALAFADATEEGLVGDALADAADVGA